VSDEIQLFNFNDNDIRVTIGSDGEPRFVAVDVCKALGLTNAPQAVAGLDDDQKHVSQVYTSTGDKQVNVVTESGLYSLVFKSHRPEAKAFRKWITTEVLPQIRKTGRYDPNEVVVPRDDFDVLISQSRQLTAAIEKMRDVKRQVDNNDKRDDHQDKQIEILHKFVSGLLESGRMTLLAYCQNRHYDFGLGNPFMSALGRKIARYCRNNNLEYSYVTHERWGHVGSYPVGALDAIVPPIWAAISIEMSLTEDQIIAEEPPENDADLLTE
jgi:prophage antirepressor-like protein